MGLWWLPSFQLKHSSDLQQSIWIYSQSGVLTNRRAAPFLSWVKYTHQHKLPEMHSPGAAAAVNLWRPDSLVRAPWSVRWARSPPTETLGPVRHSHWHICPHHVVLTMWSYPERHWAYVVLSKLRKHSWVPTAPNTYLCCWFTGLIHKVWPYFISPFTVLWLHCP